MGHGRMDGALECVREGMSEEEGKGSDVKVIIRDGFFKQPP